MKRTIERITRTAMLAVAFMLCATSGAWAEETTTQLTAPAAWGGTKPVAVWNGDFVSSLGTDKRGTAEYAVNDRYFTINNGVITIGSSYGGMWIHTTTGQSFPISIVTGLSDVPTPANDGYASLITMRPNLSNTTETWQNYIGIMINSSRGFQTCFGGTARISATTYGSTYPSGSTRSYFSLVYPYNVKYSYNDKYTEGYLNGTKVIQEQLWSTTANYDKTLGFNIGGRYNDNSWNATGMKVHYVAILNTANHSEVANWELTNMTAAENITLTDGVGALVGGANVGVNLNGGTVTVSGVKTAAALFVQGDTTLDFSGDTTSRLDISGPIYVADGKTLTIKLGALSNGYRNPVTMGSCFAGENQVVLKYETPAGSTSTPVVSGTAIRVFTEESGQTPEAIDYTKWLTSVNSVWTWKETAGKYFHEGQLAKFDVSTQQDSDTTYAGNATDAPLSGNEQRTLYDGAKTGQFWYYLAYTHNTSDKIKGFYVAPGRALRLIADGDDTYTKNLDATFAPLTLGGLLVETGAQGYLMSSTGTRTTILGNPSGTSEAWFDLKESLTINREGWLRLVGTNNINVATATIFDLNSAQATEANYPTIVGTVSNDSDTYATTAGGCLKMHGGGQIAAKKLTATGACLDYSDLSAAREVPYIDAQLVVDSNTSYKFPALAEAATYQLAYRLSDTSGITGDQTFSIGGHEYQAPLTFNDSDGTVNFPAVATLVGSETPIAWSAIAWDAKPATIDNTTVATLNITGNTTLDIDSAIAVEKLVLNIADGVTFTLINDDNLTTVEGIVIRGTGTLKIDGAVTCAALVVEDNVTLAYNSPATSLVVSGAITVSTGKTLTLAPSAINSVSCSILNADSIDGTVCTTLPVEEGYTYSSLDTETSYKIVRTPNVAFSYDGTIGATPTGWFTAWGGEGFGDRLRVGPNSDRSIVYEVYHDSNDVKAHPYYGLSARSAFSFALYADVSQVGSDGRKVLASFGNSSAGLVLYRQGNYVRVGRVTSAGFTGDWTAAVAIPASGYHLYTVTYDPNGTIALYLDDGASSSSSSTLGAMSLDAGMQIGGMYRGVPTADVFNDAVFAQGVGMAFAAIRCYDSVLAADNVKALAQQFPATDGKIDRHIIFDGEGKTLTVYSAVEADGVSTFFGVEAGTVVIPSGETVVVSNVRNANTGSNKTGTLTINGKLQVTAVSTAPDVVDNGSNKGIVNGWWSGSGSSIINVTGELDAPNAYLEVIYQNNAASGTLNVDGGTVKVKGLYAHSNADNKGHVTISNGGVLELGEEVDSLRIIEKSFGSGTYRVKGSGTEDGSIAFTSTDSSNPTTLDPYGCTLTLNGMTGAGYVTVDDTSDVGNGKVVFGGAVNTFTGYVVMTDANAGNIDISGYTGTVLCQGTEATTIAMFDRFAGTVYFTSNVDATALDLSGATVHIADNCTFTAVAGKEGSLVLGSGAVATLNVDDNTVKYEGYVPVVSGSGTVGYYNTDTSEAVSGADYVNGNNLLPYYNVWSASATASENTLSTNAAARWKSDDGVSGVLPADNKNVAFKLENGDTVTLLVDATKTFNDIQVFGNGTLIIQQSGNNVLTVGKGLYTTANTGVQIDSGLAFASGAKLDVACAMPWSIGVNCGTAESPFEIPDITITGSGWLIIAENKGLTTGSLTVGTLMVQGKLALTGAGSATTASVYAGGVVDVSSGTSLTVPTLAVNGTLIMGGNTLSATTISGTGRVEYTNKLPDTSSWSTGTASTGWRGTVAFSQTSNLTGPNLNNYGNACSTVALTGVSGSNTYLSDTDITTNVRVEGTVTINNGNPIDQSDFNWTKPRVVVMPSLDVNGVLTFRKVGNTAWNPTAYCYYYTSVLKYGSGGSIDVGNQFCLRVDAVDFASALSGNACQVPLTLTRGGDNKADGILYGPNGVAGEVLPVTVGGVANGQKLVHATVNDTTGLYLAVASVTENETTTYYPTLAAVKAAVGDNSVTINLLADTSEDIELAYGQALDTGATTYTGEVSGANGASIYVDGTTHKVRYGTIFSVW